MLIKSARRAISMRSFALSMLLLTSHGFREQILAQTGGSTTTQSTVVFRADPRMPDSPVVVTGIYVAGKAIEAGEPVTVAGDWIKSIRVRVQNVSPKAIVFGTAKLIFPDTTTTGNPPITVVGAVTRGQWPAEALYKRDGTKLNLPPADVAQAAINIPPNASMSFSFATTGDELQAQVYGQTTSVKTVVITLGAFYFADHTRYVQGNFAVPTSSSGNWKSISAKEFFAVGSQN